MDHNTSPDADSNPVTRVRDLLSPTTIRTLAENVARYIERYIDEPILERCEYCDRLLFCEDNCPNIFRQAVVELSLLFDDLSDICSRDDGLLDFLAEQASDDPLPRPSDADEPDPDAEEPS